MTNRFLPSSIGALFVTIGLGVFMAEMISVEFSPQTKSDTANFEINPIVEDLAAPPPRNPPQKDNEMEVPPPAPRIDHIKVTQPNVRPIDVEGAIPDFSLPDINIEPQFLLVNDGDAIPHVRVPPIMPLRAQRSGHCAVSFDVSVEGAPFNIQTPYCSDSIFKRATVKSVARWKYKAKIQNGQPVMRRNVRNKVIFRLLDDRGNIIPE